VGRVDTGPFRFGAPVERTGPGGLEPFIRRANPRYTFYRHTKTIIDVLERVAAGELKRVMFFLPPRHSKSETISRLFSAYYLRRHPDRYVALTSYAAELAYTLSRAARENYTRAGGALSDDASAVKHWETGQGGGLWATGVGGPATGKGFSLGIIDDPLKNAEEAQSVTIREKQKEWYASTFYTRAEPDAAIIVVQTRWHEDDLAGWLLSQEGDPETSEGWHVVNMPALFDPEPIELPSSCTLEPDPREAGDALNPERFTAERLHKIRDRIGPYYFAALYQQRPRPKEGGFFKWDWFPIADAAPVEATRVRYWDTAGTEAGGDYTVGVRMARTPEGVFYVEDVVRGQWSPARRDAQIRETAERDAEETCNTVQIWLEREAGIGGADRTTTLIRMLAGFPVHAEPATGSKIVRADPLASQAEAGNVRVVRGDWNRAFLSELADFPYGKNDDQVDAAAGALNKLALAPEYHEPEPYTAATRGRI